MPWGYAAAAVGGALISSDASHSAVNKQSDASDRATAEEGRQYDLYRSDQKPYREAGYGSLAEIGRLLGLTGDPHSSGFGSLNAKFTGADLANDPGYQFRQEQGQKTLENSAAARGGLLSGAGGEAISQYGQNFASNEFQSAWERDKAEKDTQFNRLASQAGLGQTATQATGAAGEHYADAYGNNLIGGANAQAAAQLAGANQWGNAFQAIGGAGINALRPGANPYTSPGAGGGYANPYGSGSGIDEYGQLGGYASAGDYSDEDLKTDVEPIDIRPDGLRVYAFRYLWDRKRRIGLMAHEVESLYPQAVSRDAVGFRMVDYSKVP